VVLPQTPLPYDAEEDDQKAEGLEQGCPELELDEQSQKKGNGQS
jgi:hypothetical protein